MLDVASPFFWLWLLILGIASTIFFKRQALLFWLLVLPALMALKLEVPSLLISAGVGAQLVGLGYGVLTRASSTGNTNQVSGQARLANTIHLKLPLSLSLALILTCNVGIAWLLLQFFDPDLWFQQKHVTTKTYIAIYTLLGSVTALLISLPLLDFGPNKHNDPFRKP